MSRSEHQQDASMDEILASIRKIITDDSPESPDADALAHAALDDFRDAGVALAPATPARNYMGDLTRALSAPAERAATEDDIFDEAEPGPQPGYAKRVSDALAEAIRAPHGVRAPASDDDTDLFEPEAPPLEVDAAIDAVVPLEVDAAEAEEEIAAELDDPISLGPEIELVDEPIEVAEPTAAASVAVTAEVPAPAAVTVQEVVAAVPPPPPPPVLSAVVEDVASSADEVAAAAVEDVPSGISESIGDALKDTIEQASALESILPPDTVAGVVGEAVVASEPPAVTAVVETAVEATTEAALESIAQSLQATAAALLEDTSAPASEAIADAAEPMPEPAATTAELPPVEDTPQAAQPSQSPAPLVPDEMMAAMLKPMLKEWLDANMPRIVAKAMGEKDVAATPSD